MKRFDKRKWKKWVTKLTKENTEGIKVNGYPINVEFSTNENHLIQKKQVLENFNKKLVEFKWMMYYCDVCKEHNPDCPIHVDLIPEKFKHEYSEEFI